MTSQPTTQSRSHDDTSGGSLAGSAWLGTPSPGLIGWAERGWIPDALVRLGIRRQLRERLRLEGVNDPTRLDVRQRELAAHCDASAVAVATIDANRQHYEVPAAFYDLVLGPHRKYSSAWFSAATDDLATAEATMLAKTCERAELKDGQRILELGCGWGSLTLWMAKAYPNANIVAVSNSNRQRSHILALAAQDGLKNIQVITADLTDFATADRFDRVVSVECFEHMRNHRELFRRIRTWLQPEGKVFIHVFTHRTASYLFEQEGDDDWMARHFFSGGMMPSDNWFVRLQDDLHLEEHWRVSGTHYARTAEAWLRNLDRHGSACRDIFIADGLSSQASKLQVNRWRIFFLACAELWGYSGGAEWLVSHYRFGAR